MPLPTYGEWHLSNPLWGANPPFAILGVDLARKTGWARLYQTTYQLDLVAIITDTRFGGKYRVGATRGLFEAEYHGDQTLTMDFIGAVHTCCTARPITVTGGVTPVSSMTTSQKLEAAMAKSKDYMSEELWGQVSAMFTPEAMAIMTTVVAAWAIGHFFGVGEAADLVLLIVGWLALGATAVELGSELYEFAITANGALTNDDIDKAARHFAKALSIAGVQAVLAVLTLRKPKGPVFDKKLVPVKTPPPMEGRLFYRPRVRVVKPGELGKGVRGATSPFGDVRIAPGLSARGEAIARMHEAVHSFLAPKFALLREVRAQIAHRGYHNSMLLKYIEEALAQTVALVRTDGPGLESVLNGLSFPLKNGYVSLAYMAGEAEGILVGPVRCASRMIYVYFNSEVVPEAAHDYNIR